MQHIHMHLHFLPVLVSAVVQWFLGALWYSPVLFARPWAAMVNLKAQNKSKVMIGGMVASFAGSLLTSLALAHFVVWAHASTFGWGAFVGFLSWVGFIAAPQYAQGIYESRPGRLLAINVGYWLVGLLITGGLLAVWH